MKMPSPRAVLDKVFIGLLWSIVLVGAGALGILMDWLSVLKWSAGIVVFFAVLVYINGAYAENRWDWWKSSVKEERERQENLRGL